MPAVLRTRIPGTPLPTAPMGAGGSPLRGEDGVKIGAAAAVAAGQGEGVVDDVEGKAAGLRAHQLRLQERRPLLLQHLVPPDVALWEWGGLSDFFFWGVERGAGVPARPNPRPTLQTRATRGTRSLSKKSNSSAVSSKKK